MKNALLGLTVPVLLMLAAASATIAYPASAQATTHDISGRVVDENGDPISGVQVSGYTWHEDPTRSSTSSNDNAITDDDGRFTLTLAEGKGSVSIYYEKWRRSEYREISVGAENSELLFTLVTPPPKTAIITGVVVGPDGQPIAGADVQLSYACCYAMPASTEPAVASDGGSADEKMVASTRPAIMPPYYDDYGSAVTDSEGRFRFEAYGGPRQITAWAKGYAQTSLQVEAVENQTTEVKIELEKVPARDAILSGRVVNDDTGEPVKGAVVSLRSLEWGRYAEYRTGDDGRYRIQTVPGWTEITINFWPDYGEPVPLAAESDAPVSSDAMVIRPVVESSYFPLSLLVKLESGDNDKDIELEPKPKATIALIGYVVDPDAKTGVEGARVNVWNHETGDWGEALTDKTGSFKILVRPGHYSGSAWKDGYLGGTQSFVVDDDATERVDLLLPKGVARYAPCYDEECGPVIMYADAKSGGGSTGSAGTATAVAGEAPPAPAGAPTSARSSAVEESDASAAGAQGPDTSRAATFSGSGGGLPEYDPDAAPSATTSDGQNAASEVPGLGVLALIAIAGLGALALRSRRER